MDLFAGIGGIRLAFQMAFGSEIEFVFASEIYEPAIRVYEANFGERPAGDITKIPPDEVPDHDILLAGWPCQSFSMAGRKEGFRDPRGNLFFAISNILEAKRPYAFLLENVWYLKNHDRGRTFRTIMDILEGELGYTVYHDVLNAKYYGVPQNRPRIFIVGFREPIKFEFPPPSASVPKLSDILERNVPPKYYLSQRYLEGLKKHRERHENKGHGFGYMVLDPDGVAHALVIGGMGRERNLVRDVVPPGAYKGPGDDPRKPNSEGIRRLTPRECARLMGFPDWFKLPVADTYAYRVLAESVAVPLVKKIAERMKAAIEAGELAGLSRYASDTNRRGVFRNAAGKGVQV
ncbi:MAG: DNA (cytosine-5-)-methyltransferase [Thermofilaceae archaeon]